MALPYTRTHPAPTAQLTAPVERPPQSGWYWNSNSLARAWLPLIGPEGLGLLDFYLAMADHRPGAAAPGWAAVTLAELCHLTGWGRARLVRLNRLLVASGLLAVRQEPVPGRGPAVQRSLYRVCRTAGPPDAASLERLAALAAQDAVLAGRLRRYTAPRPAASASQPAAATAAPAPHEERPAAPDRTRPRMPAPGGEARDEPGAATRPEPGWPQAPGPVPSRHRSVDKVKTERITTTSARADEQQALACWQAANGRAASCLEHQRLAQLAIQVEPVARASDASGWSWVAAAIAEAVEAGSAYVAPRRVARILERWAEPGQVDIKAGRQDDRRRPRPAGRTSGRGREATVRVADAGHPGETEDQLASEATHVTLPVVESAPNWQPPSALPGLPAVPTAVLHAALAASGLEREPYLRGAALAGWSGAGHLLVATPAPLPPVIAGRLQPRLAAGLAQVVGRPVACVLVPVAELIAGTQERPVE